MAHGVIDALRALDQAGEDFVEVVYRKGVINSEIGNRTLRAKAVAVPQLHLRVTLSAEQDNLTLSTSGHQHKHGIGFFKTGEIEQITILAEGIFRIAAAGDLARTGNDRNALAIHHRHQFFAAAGKFSFGDFHCCLPVKIAPH